jgi:hypothetical protein
MKTNLLRASIFSVLAATAAFAQNPTQLKADIPFDFIVGSKMLPAGQYTVSRGAALGSVAIRSKDCAKTALVLAQAVPSAVTRATGSLVFHRYGETYFLSEIWNPGNNGQRLPAASRELEFAAKMAAPANTIIAAVH